MLQLLAQLRFPETSPLQVGLLCKDSGQAWAALRIHFMILSGLESL